MLPVNWFPASLGAHKPVQKLIYEDRVPDYRILVSGSFGAQNSSETASESLPPKRSRKEVERRAQKQIYDNRGSDSRKLVSGPEILSRN